MAKKISKVKHYVPYTELGMMDGEPRGPDAGGLYRFTRNAFRVKGTAYDAATNTAFNVKSEITWTGATQPIPGAVMRQCDGPNNDDRFVIKYTDNQLTVQKIPANAQNIILRISDATGGPESLPITVQFVDSCDVAGANCSVHNENGYSGPSRFTLAGGFGVPDEQKPDLWIPIPNVTRGTQSSFVLVYTDSPVATVEIIPLDEKDKVVGEGRYFGTLTSSVWGISTFLLDLSEVTKPKEVVRLRIEARGISKFTTGDIKVG